jgi:uroporphyrinogen decarboxylase
MYKTPDKAHELLHRITQVTVQYLIGQVQAGAQMLEVFDSWAGDLSLDLFTRFAFPYLKQIATEVKAGLRKLGLPPVPMTVFAKGANYGLEMLANDTEYDCLAIDWSVSSKSS